MLLSLEQAIDHQCILIVRKKNILVLGEGPTQEIDNITITTEAKYSISFSKSQWKFCLSLHYNGSNSFLFVNSKKIYQHGKTGLNGYVYDFFIA